MLLVDDHYSEVEVLVVEKKQAFVVIVVVVPEHDLIGSYWF